jgi:uncharacterized repeat protein (TIGR03803 family)
MRQKKYWFIVGMVLAVTAVALVLAPSAWAQGKYKTLYKFTGGADGNGFFHNQAPGQPFDEFFAPRLVLDGNGNLYGTTPAGGANGYGVVFKLTPNSDGSWTQNVLYSFAGGQDGANPLAGAIFDTAGNLYGTTYLGGNHGDGTVFELTPHSNGNWTESTLYSFTGGKDGGLPEMALTFDGVGNLYGTTKAGGIDNCSLWRGCGVVFELTPNLQGGWTQSVLHAFTGGRDGRGQISSLVFDATGNLYGTAQGINYAGGVVFKLMPGATGWTETILYNFTNAGGGGWDPFSFAGLAFDAVGDIYGTTFWGNGHSAGVVFRLTLGQNGKWSEKVLHTFFNGSSGGTNPEAGVIFDAAGNLYGTTYFGGVRGYGVLFKLTPTPTGGWKESVLHSFYNHPGAYPLGRLMFDAIGNLYGITTGDGSTTFGSVFEITP